MSPKEICTKLSLRIVNFYLKSSTSFAFILPYIYMCGSVFRKRIRIQKAPEYGSGSTTLLTNNLLGVVLNPRPSDYEKSIFTTLDHKGVLFRVNLGRLQPLQFINLEFNSSLPLGVAAAQRGRFRSLLGRHPILFLFTTLCVRSVLFPLVVGGEMGQELKPPPSLHPWPISRLVAQSSNS